MKIKIEDIQSYLQENNWKLISTSYKNQEEEMTFECPNGHQVFSSWRKMKSKLVCPQCQQNVYANVENKPTRKPAGAIRILALDQATRITGWSIYDDNKLVSYGIFETTKEDEIERCNEIKQWLASMIHNWHPAVVGLEDIQYQDESNKQKISVTVFKTLAHLQGILMEFCYEIHIPYKLCHTATWRQACGVKGKTRSDRKRSMQLIVKKWYDINVSEDEADAIGIGKYLTGNLVENIEMEDWE